MLTAVIAQPAVNNEGIKTFFDCQSHGCDFDYIRTEIKWVDFVRDRTDANIHILVTSQYINGGGEKIYLNFIGQKRFQNISDTLSFFNDANNTSDDKRKLMVTFLKIGLTRYISKTDLAKNIDILYKYPSEKINKSDSAQLNKDPWNLWIFNMGVRGNLNGSEVYKSSSFGGNFSANRTTEKLKTNFSINYNKRISKSTYGLEVIKVKSKSLDIHFGDAFSINNKWSWGFDADYSNSLFSNLKNRYGFSAKAEYNIYPYSMSNSKSVTFGYYIGPQYNQYYDTTIFFQTKELLFKQTITSSASFTQPWGSISSGIFYSTYFHDFTKNNLSIIGSLNIRIFKGLSINAFGNYSLTHDQLSLPKGTATRDDVLTQRRLIFSGYNYYTSIGLQYRFGSKYNNVVNTRFNGIGFQFF
ncbi:MAG: hypothetical protein M3004_01910 [Bacteroidota bacterium]|nr:hypothetical protein [Bacteroidota bacterium]